MSDRATLTEAPSLQVIVPGPAVFLRQGAVDGGFAVEAEFVEGRLTCRGQPSAVGLSEQIFGGNEQVPGRDQSD